MTNTKRLLAIAVTAALAAPMSAFATNGMNMEGYGPIATGMGGASMAYDNGTAAMANNVATLGLVDEGSRFDIAVGVLSPDINSEDYQQKSKATQFIMPGIGYAKKSGQMTYGVGVYGQGGMGTEYDVQLPDGSFNKDRSEVGVGRLIVPVAYNVNDALTIGASLDYVWATMDLQMTAPASMLAGMVTGGSMAGSLPGNMVAGRFDFSDDNDFSGAAKGYGFAGKLGLTYSVSSELTFGASYQAKTALSDMKTGTSSATLTVYTDDPATMAMTGQIKVKNFQWPETFAVGMSYKPNNQLMIVADVKQIQWADVMENFQMSFTADAASGGGTLDVTMPQNWKDQTVFQLGGAYGVTDAFTLRAGLNLSSNPVPNDTVNSLFPAIIKDHYTAGFGYMFSDASEVNFSLTHAPKVTVTNTNSGNEISHAQTNWQLMYSHSF